MKHLILFIFINLVSINSVFSKDYGNCETFANVKLDSKYSANFLNKEYLGCFKFSIKNGEYTGGIISISLGNKVKEINTVSLAKIAYQTFTLIEDSNKINKSLTTDVDENIQSIKDEAIKAADKIDNDLNSYIDSYKSDAIPQLKENQKSLKVDSNVIELRINSLKNKLNNFKVVSQDLALPASNVGLNFKGMSQVEKEKFRWDKIKNKDSIPFRSLDKISKANNKALTNQLLKEIKIERYNQLGLTQVKSLPLLNEVKKYEYKENIYNQKLDLINNNPSLTSRYTSNELHKIKQISSEFKNESENYLIKGEIDNANDSIDMAYVALDVATSLPLISIGRGAYELYTGKSLIDGHELDTAEKSIAAAMLLIDLTPASLVARGTQIAATLGKVGARLVEKQIVKSGFEEGLRLGVQHANVFRTAVTSYVSKGLLKAHVVKLAIDHKLFFKYLDQEEYIASKLLLNLNRFDHISSILAKEGIESSIGLNHYLANSIYYEQTFLSNSESIVDTANEYMRIENNFKLIQHTSTEDLTVVRVAKDIKNPFNTDNKWYQINMKNDHRYTQQGEVGLYATINNDTNSLNAAFSEAQIPASFRSNIEFQEKKFSHSKVLDLSDKNTLEALNVNYKNIIKDDYFSTQIIGHVAKFNNYDAIIFPGTHIISSTGEVINPYLNYVILKGF